MPSYYILLDLCYLLAMPFLVLGPAILLALLLRANSINHIHIDD